MGNRHPVVAGGVVSRLTQRVWELTLFYGLKIVYIVCDEYRFPMIMVFTFFPNQENLGWIWN
jgi:hypothetical protein